MAIDPAYVVRVDERGAMEPAGDLAARAVGAHAGTFDVLPSPAEVIVLRRAGAGGRRCALSGEVTTTGALCDVVGFIGHASYSGEFVVMDGAAARSVFFREGRVVGAASTADHERLGDLLHQRGILGRAEVDEVARSARAKALHIGEAAVELGHLTQERLFELLRAQCEEIFFGMMLIGRGAFYLLDAFDDAALSVRLDLPVAPLVREGVRRMHEMQYFRARVPSPGHVPSRTPGQRAPDEGGTLPLYDAIDGRRSVADLCRLLGEREFDVTRSVFLLVQSGHVEVRAPSLDVEGAIAVYNEAIALILRELDGLDEGDAVRRQLAAFAATREPYAALFDDAGPADDGTLDAARVRANLAAPDLAAIAGAEAAVPRWLHEFASYALFLARPHLRRSQEGRTSPSAPRPRRFSERVASVLEPIAPGPPSGAPGALDDEAATGQRPA